MTPSSNNEKPSTNTSAGHTRHIAPGKKSWGHRFFGQPSWKIALWVLALCVLIFVTQLIIIRVVELEWHHALGRYLTSPGAAVLAALIAFSAVFLQLRHNKNVEAERSWWERFEWVTARAVPVDNDHAALPHDLSLDILTSLVLRTTNDTQGRACGGFVNHLLELRNTHITDIHEDGPKSNSMDHPSEHPAEVGGSLDQHGAKVEKSLGNHGATNKDRTGWHVSRAAGSSPDRVAESIEAYSKVTQNSPARSEKVEQELYEKKVFQEVASNMPTGAAIGGLILPSAWDSTRSTWDNKGSDFMFLSAERIFILTSPAGNSIVVEPIRGFGSAMKRIDILRASGVVDQRPTVVVTAKIEDRTSVYPANLIAVEWRDPSDTPKLVESVKNFMDL